MRIRSRRAHRPVLPPSASVTTCAAYATATTQNLQPSDAENFSAPRRRHHWRWRRRCWASPAVASSSGLVTPARRFGRVDMPEIRRRTDWAPDLPVRKPIEAEDVKFLLVHHTADPDSNYQPDDVVGMLRKIYDYHTGAEKDWPDIAYNFFVDKFGRIWESRTGSVDSPLRGDATGGNQGFSQLCCFLGDFEAEQPPQEAVMSMIALLTWLADKHGLNMTPGATTTFTSRGSNKWPEGSEITTQTISTHRQMSETTCPGTACHELVTTRFQQMVSDQLPTKAPATTSSPATVSTTTPPTNDAATTTAATADSTAASADREPSAQSTTAKPDTEEQAEAKIPVAADDDGGTNWPIALGASAAAATAAGALGYGLWSKSRSEEPTPLAATGSDFAASDASTLTAPLASDLIARPSPAEFVSLAGAGVGDDVPTATTVDSPVTWWRPGAPSGSAGAASADEVLVFWLAGPAIPGTHEIASNPRCAPHLSGLVAPPVRSLGRGSPRCSPPFSPASSILLTAGSYLGWRLAVTAWRSPSAMPGSRFPVSPGTTGHVHRCLESTLARAWHIVGPSRQPTCGSPPGWAGPEPCRSVRKR